MQSCRTLAPQNPQILFAAYELARRVTDQSLLSMMVSSPDSAEMHMIMGGDCGRQGDHTNAIAHYREAIRLKPALPGAHFELAEQLRTSSDQGTERTGRRRIQARFAVEPVRRIIVAATRRYQSGEERFQAAEEDYRKALALQPGDSEPKTGLAIALISLDRRIEAISLLESALRTIPTNTRRALSSQPALQASWSRGGCAARTRRLSSLPEPQGQAGQGVQEHGAAGRTDVNWPDVNMLMMSSPLVSFVGVAVCVATLTVCLEAQRATRSPGSIPQMVDITASTRIRFNHLASPEKKYIVESMSGGVALIDYDRDGWPDIYFTNAPDVEMQLAGRKARSALFHNNRDGTFTDVTEKAGVGYPCWANGAAVGDYNNDGWPDLHGHVLRRRGSVSQQR